MIVASAAVVEQQSLLHVAHQLAVVLLTFVLEVAELELAVVLVILVVHEVEQQLVRQLPVREAEQQLVQQLLTLSVPAAMWVRKLERDVNIAQGKIKK